MVIAHVIGELAAGFADDGVVHVAQHLLGQHTLVEGLVARIGAKLRLRRHQAGIGEQRRQIQLALLRGLARQNLEQFSAPNQLRDGAHAHGGHDFPALLGDELEVVHHHLGKADEEFGAQHVVLRRHPSRAIVKVTDAQIFAAQCDHGRSAEAEALRADERGLDDVEPGLQAAVRLQTHAVPQFIGAQRLVRFRQSQLPGGAGIFDRRQWTCASAAVVT